MRTRIEGRKWVSLLSFSLFLHIVKNCVQLLGFWNYNRQMIGIERQQPRRATGKMLLFPKRACVSVCFCSGPSSTSIWCDEQMGNFITKGEYILLFFVLPFLSFFSKHNSLWKCVGEMKNNHGLNGLHIRMHNTFFGHINVQRVARLILCSEKREDFQKNE